MLTKILDNVILTKSNIDSKYIDVFILVIIQNKKAMKPPAGEKMFIHPGRTKLIASDNLLTR